VSPRQFRAASMLLCLGPGTPLIFMGQEWAARAPFLFFTHHGGELGREISAGRRRELERRGPGRGADGWPDPEAPAAFACSKLDWGEREEASHAAILALYRECLRERRLCLRESGLARERWEAQPAGEFIAVRYRLEEGERLLLATFRAAAFPPGPPPPVIAPPRGRIWRAILRSEAPRFGGGGAGAPADDWRIEGPGAAWLEAVEEGVRHAAS